MNNSVICTDLEKYLAGGAVVIDVMTPEEFAVCHLSGAKNACVYEMIFLDRIAELVPDRNTELVVYDATGATQTAELARERLSRAGYGKVSVLKGGLSAWRLAGLPVEGAAPEPVVEPTLQDGTYQVDVEKSMLEWVGRNLAKRHYGRISVQHGEIVIRNGVPVGGNIVLDMNSIADLDMQDQSWRDMLKRHLMSDDFFAVERFPTASFRLTGWDVQEGNTSHLCGGTAAGDLTIRDVTRPIVFPATVAPHADGGIQAHALLDIDRTQWNACYGSARMYERLGMHLVHDLISLELFVLAR